MAGLTPRKRKAIAAILECPTLDEAAVRAGVSHRSIHRWTNEDPDFRAALTAAQDRALDTAVSRLAAAMPAAVSALLDIVANENIAAGTRVAAARAILANGLKLVEIRDLTGRIERLEAAVQKAG